MKRTLYVIAALALITFAACKKDDEPASAAAPDRGSIRFTNTSNDLYDIFLDGNRLGDIYGGYSAVYNGLGTGFHAVSVVQTGNVMGTPTRRQQQVIVYKDSIAKFSFP